MSDYTFISPNEDEAKRIHKLLSDKGAHATKEDGTLTEVQDGKGNTLCTVTDDKDIPTELLTAATILVDKPVYIVKSDKFPWEI